MHEFSIKYLFCTRCHSKLESETLKEGGETDEGFLLCRRCGLAYPVISKIPILWDDFARYLANRPSLGGELFVLAKTAKMKSFIKNTLGMVQKTPSDIALIEKRWCAIYKANKNSRFYSTVGKMLKIPEIGLALEHGCSIGHMTRRLAETSVLAFGIDKSFYAITEAKKSKHRNLDFFVADSLEHPFAKTKFGLVMALNLFEIVEPKPLLKALAGQVKENGALVISDPYDFERGAKSVKEPLYWDSLREELVKLGFIVSKKTSSASFIPWNLKLNDRASLNYLVDLVFASRLRRAHLS